MQPRSIVWYMVHAGLYKSVVCDEEYFIVRRRGSWWLMYARDYRNTNTADIGAGNAKEFKTLERVKAHLLILDKYTRMMNAEIPL